MIKIDEYVDIRNHCTLKIGGQFRYFTVVETQSDIQEVINFAKEKNIKIFILGGGSNLVFSSTIVDALVVKIQIKSFEIINDTDEYTDIKVGAGENWDAFVGRTVDMNLSGIEALSAIPGTVGATPVQNVGAYGQEVKDTIVSVEVLDPEAGSIKTFLNSECEFAYRDSIFKNNAKNKYIILSVTFRLSKGEHKVPDYPGVKNYFQDKGIINPTLLDIRKAIIVIRSTKLPNPVEIPNVGSFFKNPIVTTQVFYSLISSTGEKVPFFDVGGDKVKIPAGWLIESVGFKGKDFGEISVYQNNALVLVNNGQATFADIEFVRNQIIRAVKDKFGITLETEPEFV
ncbi:UDP-N-acetylmuramate dehydrogenase [Candidatus Nomurabacteria bacterium]|nr:UDP-N-acetylmuramate dehydrogenase [Candidatus Nomurabacteria bacterium]